MFELKIKNYFSAAHQLFVPYGKCENLHGHNWKVEVSVIGKALDEFGMLIDFGVLKKCLLDTLSELDHKFLNDLDIFDDGNPSSENIALFIAEKMQKKINKSDITVNKVVVWESNDSSATYLVESAFGN